MWKIVGKVNSSKAKVHNVGIAVEIKCRTKFSTKEGKCCNICHATHIYQLQNTRRDILI